MARSGRAVRGARRSRGGWSEAIAEWRASGLAAEEFCRRRGLVMSTFQWWRWRLGRSTSDEPPGAVPGFAAVRVVGADAGGGLEHGRSGEALELLLPSGVRLRVPAGFDEQTVAGVLWALGVVDRC